MAPRHLVAAVLAIFGCAFIASAQAKITVFSYMMADNDLQCGMLKNLKQLLDGFKGMQLDNSTLPEFFIQFDNGGPNSCSPTLHGISSTEWTTAKRLTLEADPAGGVRYKVLRDLGEINIASTKQLSSFLQAAFQRYPPAPDRQYFLILGDHGSGYGGIGNDHVCSSKSRYSATDICAPAITMGNLSSTLQEALGAVQKSEFDMIGFDACYMGNWETLVALGPVARYVVGSEEVEPAHGWDWNAFSQLAKKPQMSVPDLGKAIIAQYTAFCQQEGTKPCTLSLYDTEALPQLTAALTTVADQISKLQSSRAAASTAGSLAVDLTMGVRQAQMADWENLVDAVNYLKSIQSTAAGAELNSTAIQAVITAVEAIQVEYGSANVPADRYMGLSIYIPQLMAYSLSFKTQPAGSRAKSTPTDKDYDALAARHKEIGIFHEMYDAVHTTAEDGSGVGEPLNVTSAKVQRQGDQFAALTTKVAPGAVPLLEADQFLGFVHPFDSERTVVTAIRKATISNENTMSTTFDLTFRALGQTLSDDAMHDFKSFFTANKIENTGSTVTMEADALYAMHCDDPYHSMQHGTLTITYNEAQDSTSVSLMAKDGKGGTSQVAPSAGGVIIPLLAEIDPQDTSHLYMNWDFSKCLKWRHASDIKLHRDPVAEYGHDGTEDPIIPQLLAAGARVMGYSTADIQLLARPLARRTESGCLCTGAGTTAETCIVSGSVAQCPVEPNSCSSPPPAFIPAPAPANARSSSTPSPAPSTPQPSDKLAQLQAQLAQMLSQPDSTTAPASSTVADLQAKLSQMLSGAKQAPSNGTLAQLQAQLLEGLSNTTAKSEQLLAQLTQKLTAKSPAPADAQQPASAANTSLTQQLLASLKAGNAELGAQIEAALMGSQGRRLQQAAAPAAQQLGTCQPLTTKVGCRCKNVWSPDGKTQLPGTCAPADEKHPEGSWCELDQAGCQGQQQEWDYCAVKTERGCRCANPWIHQGTGVQYNGTCAPVMGGMEQSRSFCMVEPGSCDTDHPLYGGDVWDWCQDAAAAQPADPTAGKGTQCIPQLLDACEDAGLTRDQDGWWTINSEQASCSVECLTAVCELTAALYTNKTTCSDMYKLAPVVTGLSRTLDSVCLNTGGFEDLVPVSLKCPMLTSLAPDNDNCPKFGKQLLEPSGTIQSTASYPSYSKCFWEIHNRQRPFITLTPKSFQTEEEYDAVYVSDAFGYVGVWSGKVAANESITTDSGYLLVEFWSDGSISAPGFTLDYTTSDKADLMHDCQAGQRAVTFFVTTKESDVYDLGWAVLVGDKADATAEGARVAAAGGSIPTNGDFPNASEAVLVAAQALAENSPEYHRWRIATEVHCLPAGSYSLLALAANDSSWAGATVSVAVSDNANLATLQWSDKQVSFTVAPPANDAEADTMAKMPMGGTFGFSAEMTIAGDWSEQDFRGVVRGMFRTAVASVLDTVTQRVIVTEAKNATQPAGGRRMLADKRMAAAATTGLFATTPKHARKARAQAAAGAYRRLASSAGTKRAASIPASMAAAEILHSAAGGAAAAPKGAARRRSLAEVSTATGPGVMISFKVIGYDSADAAKAASEALVASAKLQESSDEKLALLEVLAYEGLYEAEAVTVENVKVLDKADSSVGP